AAVTTSVLGRFGVADMDDVDWSDQVNTPFRAVLRRPRLVRAAHRHGLDVAVHTVNGPRRMRQVLDAGVDAVSTDRPVRLDRVLAGRGQRRQRDERLAAPTQWSVRAPDQAWLATRFRTGGRLSTAGAQASRWQWVSVQTRGRNGWRTWQRRVTDRHGRLSTTLWLGRDLPMRFRADGEGARPAVASRTHHVDGRRMPSNATLRGPQRLRESRTARLRVQWFADDGRAVSGPVRLYKHESDGDWDRIRSARLTDGRHAFRVRPGAGARYRLSARRGWWWRGDGDRHRIVRRG
ncbi:MAG: glycerophosphodiester phosphodiesterase, partial [Nocardioidaceae bacterium]